MRATVLSTILVCGLAAEIGSPAWAAAVTVQLFPLTGEVRLMNRGLGPVPIAFYSISSPNGALNSSPGVWWSISENYDASGNDLVDSVNEWLPFSPPGSTTELSEGVLANPGGSLPPTRSISLGRVWNPLKVPFPDLTFEIREPNSQQVGVTTEYTLDGDYNGNGTVDAADHNLYWRSTFGSTTNLLADGDLNGVIDMRDYVVWRNNYGRSLTQPPWSSGAAGVAVTPNSVPEPTAGALLILALLPALQRTAGGMLSRRRRG